MAQSTTSKIKILETHESITIPTDDHYDKVQSKISLKKLERIMSSNVGFDQMVTDEESIAKNKPKNQKKPKKGSDNKKKAEAKPKEKSKTREASEKKPDQNKTEKPQKGSKKSPKRTTSINKRSQTSSYYIRLSEKYSKDGLGNQSMKKLMTSRPDVTISREHISFPSKMNVQKKSLSKGDKLSEEMALSEMNLRDPGAKLKKKPKKTTIDEIKRKSDSKTDDSVSGIKLNQSRLIRPSRTSRIDNIKSFSSFNSSRYSVSSLRSGSVISFASSSSSEDHKKKIKGHKKEKEKEKDKDKEKEKEKEKIDFDKIPEKERIEEKKEEVTTKTKTGKKRKKVAKESKDKEVKPEKVEDIDVAIPDLKNLLPPTVTAEKEEVLTLKEEPIVEKKAKKKKPKKKKEKKLSDKERAKLEEERIIAAEQEAIRLAEEERLRLIQERKMALAKEKRDVLEQQWRSEHLELSEEHIMAMKQAGWDALMKNKIKKEWEQYLVCDGLPNPSNVAEMNTYLHLWEKEIEKVKVDQAVHRTNEVHRLLDELQKLIDDPFDEPERKQVDWKWIRSLFRNHQKDNLDFCTYRLLRDVKKNMNRLDIPSSDFRLKENHFSLCLWTLVELPTPTYNPRTPPRPRVNLEWPELNMTVVFPISLKCDLLAIRGMYVKYDHLSDTSVSHDLPPLAEIYNKSLIELTNKEWITKLRYKWDKRVKSKEPKQTILEDGSFIVVEPDRELQPDEIPPIVPYQKLEPLASDYAMSIEKQQFQEALNSLNINMDADRLNLRKYFIIGGIYYLDLLQQPTQPQEMVSFDIFITTLKSPFSLQEAPFYVTYVPPPVPEPGVRRQPEEIEEELMIQERELDKLMFITLILPTHVFWLDVPMVAHWDQQKREWTTADIHDFKHIEEKGYITFRTGRFGPFGIATYRFPNLPYQAWEVRPEKDGTVTLQLTAAILMIEFHLKNHLVSISQLQNAPNAAMDEHIGVYYTLPRLKRIMLECGIDIFPTFDSFHYIKGTCEKHWAMEKHLYFCMAMASPVFNFSWSRWNMTLDYRGVAMQMRRYKFDKNKQDNFSMVLVTPIKALMIECTEVSTIFSEEPSGGETRFYADLIHLIRGITNMASKTKIAEAALDMTNTLANLFIETRFLSFS